MADSSNMTVSLTIKVQGRDAATELAKVNAALKSTGTEVGKVTQTNKAAAASSVALASGFKDLALSILGVVSAGRALAFFRQTVNELDDLRDMSLKTGIALERLAAIDTIARKAGSSAESITATFRFINKVIEEAAQGSEDAERAFRKLGTSWEEFYRLTDEERLYSIVAGLEKLGTGAAGAKTAQTLLGRSYQELIPLIKEYGSDLGIAVDEEAKNKKGMQETADAADKLNDSLVDMGASLKRLINKETIEGFEYLTKAAVSAVQAIAQFGNMIGSGAQWWRDEFVGGGDPDPDQSALDAGRAKANSPAAREAALAAKQNALIAAFAKEMQAEIDAEAKKDAEIAAMKLEGQEKEAAELAKQAEDARQQELEAIMNWVAQVEESRLEMSIAGIEEIRDRRIKAAMDAGASEEQMQAVTQAAFEEAGERIAKIIEERAEAEKSAHDKVMGFMDKEHQKLIEIEEERARAAEVQNTLNAELEKSGDFWGGMRQGSRDFKKSIGTDFEQGQRMMVAGLDSISDSASRAFTGIIDGSMSAGEAFKNFAGSVLQDISQMIVKLMVLRAVQSAVGFATGGVSAGEMNWYDAQPDPFEGYGVASSAGGIAGTPAMAMSGGSSSQTVVVQNYNISAVDQQGVARLFSSPEFQRSQRAAQINNEKRNTATRSNRR
mgnify:CR=1 FL=1